MTIRMTPVALALSLLALPPWTAARADATDQSTSETSLPAVNVSADAQRSSDLPAPYAGGQVATGARLGMLGNQEIMDTPFNITSYTAELIEDQNARTVAEVLENDPSVRNTTTSGHAYENFRIRGFNVDQNELAIDGMYGMTPAGHTPLEMFERVEVLKGPGAMFAGMAPNGGVGGVINLVPKRAGDDPLTRVSLGYQTASQLGSTIDVGRRFGEHKEFGVRVNGSLSDGETVLEGQDKKREFVSAALDYRSSALKASLDAYHSNESYSGGTPAMFWFATTDIPAAPDAQTNQFPGARGELQTDAAIVRAELALNDKVSAFAALGAAQTDYTGFMNGSHVRNINANGNSTTSVTVAQRGYESNFATEAGLRGRLRSGAVAHELVLQVSNLEQETGSASTTRNIALTNIYQPSYADMPATPATAPKTAENSWSSVALVDTLSLLEEKLRLTLGLRRQTVKTDNYSDGAISASYEKSATTPAVGVVVKPWGEQLALYANYVEGLSKGDSVKQASGYAQDYTFAPYKTEQKEVGVKWNAGSFAHTASLFEIAKPMRVTSGTAPNLVASIDGEKRVRGLEWNTFGEVVRNVRLLGGAAYSRGEQTRTQGGVNDGKDAVGVPRWQGNLGLEWDTPWLPGVTLSGRMTATSSQYLDAANTMSIPGWSVFDLGLRHSSKVAGRKVVTRLNVDNLFDRAYYSGSFSDSTPIATLGQGRVISLSATVDF